MRGEWGGRCYDPGVSAAGFRITIAVGLLLLAVGLVVELLREAGAEFLPAWAVPWLPWVCVAVLTAAGMVLIFWDRIVLPFPLRRPTGRAITPEDAQPKPPLTPVEEILEDLRAKYGPDLTRAIVGDTDVRRRRPDSPSAHGTDAAAHVVQYNIRRARDEPPPKQLELLVAREFEELIQKADSRTAEQQERAFQTFGQAARKLAAKLSATLDQRKAQGRMRERDRKALGALLVRAEEALLGVPLDKYCEYAEDLSKVRNMVRSEHPGDGQDPFTVRDFRSRLERDGVR